MVGFPLEVKRADYNASMIVQKLFEKYYQNPRLLHSGTVHKIFLETLNHPNIEVSNSAIFFSDASIELVNKEIEEITSKELDETLIFKYLVTRKGTLDSSCFSQCQQISNLQIKELEKIVQKYSTPEYINNSEQTAPSKRILSVYLPGN